MKHLNFTMYQRDIPSTQCKDGIYYECIFGRHTNVKSDVGILQKMHLYHITLTRNRVIQFFIQNTYSATYIGLILGTRCCL